MVSALDGLAKNKPNSDEGKAKLKQWWTLEKKWLNREEKLKREERANLENIRQEWEEMKKKGVGQAVSRKVPNISPGKSSTRRRSISGTQIEEMRNVARSTPEEEESRKSKEEAVAELGGVDAGTRGS